MGNEEESYGYAVVLGLCNNSCQCSRIYRILGCPWTSYKVVYSKVEEIIKQQNRFIYCIKKGLWNKSLKEIGPFVNAKGPIFVVKLTYDENFTQ